MSKFKISPVTQCKTREKPRFLSWLFLLVLVLQTIAGGYWFFRLNSQITQLKLQIETLQQRNNMEACDVQ
jgi:Tfp pilus assembly protein PilN